MFVWALCSQSLTLWGKVISFVSYLVKHVFQKKFSLSMYMNFVIAVLWPSKCYLTVSVVRKTRTLPQFRVAFAGSAQWRWVIWLASVNTHVLEQLLKKPAVIRSDQIRINLSVELLFEWQGTSSSGKMVDKFVGTWKMTSSDNFDEYMKAIGMILHYLVTCKYFQFSKCERKV